MAAAKAIGATAIMYPRPAAELEPAERDAKCGVRVGLIAREDNDEAWGVAHERFPEDRRGQITHKVAMKTSELGVAQTAVRAR